MFRNKLANLVGRFENKVLRKIVGPICECEIWRWRKTENYMQHIRILTLPPSLKYQIKTVRWKFAGQQENYTKAYQVGCNRERPESQWESSVLGDPK